MTLEFATKQLDAQPILGIRTVVTHDKIGEAMGPLFGEVFGYIQQNGQAPAGMPFAIYYHMDGGPLDVDGEECADGGSIDMECGMPVAAPLDGSGRIKASELPAGKVATVTHMGPYNNLPQTWSALTRWMEAQGLEPAGAPWEVYVTDPGAEPDQSKWRTDIFFPVR